MNFFANVFDVVGVLHDGNERHHRLAVLNNAANRGTLKNIGHCSIGSLLFLTGFVRGFGA